MRLSLRSCSAIIVLAGVSFPAVSSAAEPVSAGLRQMETWGASARTAHAMLILFQLAAILFSAKVLGWLAERIKVPGVIGELVAGILIGPFLFGAMIQVPLGHGHTAALFPAPVGGEWPVNDVIWTMAQVASIVLLFVTGLHTDLKQFLRYVGPATLVAAAGVLVPSTLGAALVYVPAFKSLATAHPESHPPLVSALFVGVTLAATSIGITARVLGDMNKLDTPEGVTILGAAVLDDVLGIVALAIVGGIAATGSVSAGTVGVVAGKAFGFWIGLTVAVLLLSKWIERFIGHINYAGATVGLGLALAIACSGAAESAGLAFIIGAYSVGLGLSQRKLAHHLMEGLQGVSDFFVPIFFVGLGMLVNVKAMFASGPVILFGVAVTLAAIIGKLLGCGLAALPGGFNARGAYRIGLGMLPRGEVALIVAGIGLSSGIVGEVVFGVTIMMTLVTTILAPILLVPAFARGGSGRRKEVEVRDATQVVEGPCSELHLPPAIAEAFVEALIEVASADGWGIAYEDAESDSYLLLRAPDAAAELSLRDGTLRVGTSAGHELEWRDYVERVRNTMTQQIQTARLAPVPPTG
jgi:Kef-type K+ transport system membrane component KefB